MAHFAEYDRDDVLKPLYTALGHEGRLPKDERWVCTWKLAHERTDLVPDYVPKGLDSLLKHFGFQ